MKTMVTDERKPIVYHAETLGDDPSSKLLLDGQDSISVLPFDCDDKFINVTVSNRQWDNYCRVSNNHNTDTTYPQTFTPGLYRPW